MTDIEAIYRLMLNLMWASVIQPPQKDITFLKSLKSTLNNLYKDAYNEGLKDALEVSSKYRRSTEEIEELNNLKK